MWRAQAKSSRQAARRVSCSRKTIRWLRKSPRPSGRHPAFVQQRRRDQRERGERRRCRRRASAACAGRRSSRARSARPASALPARNAARARAEAGGSLTASGWRGLLAASREGLLAIVPGVARVAARGLGLLEHPAGGAAIERIGRHQVVKLRHPLQDAAALAHEIRAIVLVTAHRSETPPARRCSRCAESTSATARRERSSERCGSPRIPVEISSMRESGSSR